MNGPITAAAIVLGDHVNTDLLCPPQFFSADKRMVRAGFLRGLSLDVPEARHYIIIAGKNFGCGSSRETTIYALIESGVAMICADSFGRVFRRSASNLCLPCYEISERIAPVKIGDVLIVAPKTHRVYTEFGETVVRLKPMEKYFSSVIESGGLAVFMETLCKK